MHRPAKIDVRRGLCFYSATVTLRDDGMNEDGTQRAYRAFEVEEGPYFGLTHRRAWRNAYRAHGSMLYDIPSGAELSAIDGRQRPRDPGLRQRA